MTHRIDLKRGFLAALTAVAVALALVLVAGGSSASADHLDSWPISSDANKASFWEQWGADNEGEDDWVCVKDDRGSDGAYVIGDPPGGSVWRLLVVKAGSTVNDLNWNPLSGQSFEHSQQGGWSHVILCSRPIPQSTTTVPEATTTVPEATTTVPEATTTVPEATTTVPEATTTVPEATTTTAEVLATTITASPTTTDPGVSATDETLPFTGFENGTSGLLALILVASGALALVGARVLRDETDE